MKVDRVACGLVAICNCFNHLAYFFFSLGSSSDKSRSLWSFKVTVSSWCERVLDSSNCSELITRDRNNLWLSEKCHYTSALHIFVRSAYTDVFGITCSKLLYKSRVSMFSALLMHRHCSPNLPELCNPMGWGEKKVSSELWYQFFFAKDA